jgi:hypothetical protein
MLRYTLLSLTVFFLAIHAVQAASSGSLRQPLKKGQHKVTTTCGCICFHRNANARLRSCCFFPTSQINSIARSYSYQHQQAVHIFQVIQRQMPERLSLSRPKPSLSFTHPIQTRVCLWLELFAIRAYPASAQIPPRRNRRISR